MNWIKWNIWMPIRNAFVLLRGCKKRHHVSYPDLIDAMAGAIDKLEERTAGFANQDAEQMRKDLEKLLPLMELLPLLEKYQRGGETVEENIPVLRIVKIGEKLAKLEKELNNLKDEINKPKPIPIPKVIQHGN